MLNLNIRSLVSHFLTEMLYFLKMQFSVCSISDKSIANPTKKILIKKEKEKEKELRLIFVFS